MILGLVLAMGFFSACENELTTIGAGVTGGQAFGTGKQVYDVFAYNKNIVAVRTNKLPLYQLGRYSHPVFGNTKASITTQLQLSTANPIFGSFPQSTEDIAETDAAVNTILENETIKEVYLYIPYLTEGAVRDRDADGVPDEFDSAPDDPENDSDGDGISNRLERVANTDPLNSESLDANLDGKNDTDDVEIIPNNFAKRVAIDSIYGAIDAPFKIKVEQSTYFLRDLDPNTNFQESQAYYSSQEFSPSFVNEVLYDSEDSGELLIDDMEILLPQKDNAATEDVDESITFIKRPPGIRVPLNNDFFQDYILDMEGSSELFTQANFSTFLRGIHISLDTEDPQGLMLLLDLRQANIVMTYTHDFYDTNATPTDVSDDTTSVLEKDFTISLTTVNPSALGGIAGNAVNTLINDDYPANILETLDTGDSASRIYIKGGAGVFAEINIFDPNNGFDIVSQIQAENWIINEANLVFYIDREQLDQMGGVIEPPRLYLYNAETNFPLYNTFTDRGPQRDDLFPLLTSYPNYGGVIEKEGNKGVRYKVNITDYINTLVVRDAVNATLGLTLTTNIATTAAANTILANGEERFIPVTSTLTPLGTVLYGPNIPATDPNFDKRLKLEISYTKPE